MDILVKREVAKRMQSPSQVECSPVSPKMKHQFPPLHDIC